jgi:hypothetical protein
MADPVYMGADPWSTLSLEHGQLSQNQNAIRHDVASGFADTRYDVATRAGDIRSEVNEGVGDIRYDVATRNADTRFAVASGQADIRREQALGFGDTRYTIASHSEDTNRDILTTGYQVRDKVDAVGDAILQRSADFFIAEQSRDFDMGRDLSDLKATVLMANQKTAGDIALAAERAIGATALGQAQTGKEILESRLEITNLSRDLARQIGAENEKTRDLIQALKNDELNRILIERNTDLTHCRHDYWGARDGLFNTQFAALSSQVNSQLNALNSQVAETRQGLVNFGTMAGNAGQQSSTSNQVR